ncbi:MAG: hypothetical protein FH762_01425 [Firmicutes bacterium]|nr:hypothetical protein [Bacillota bacterium]
MGIGCTVFASDTVEDDYALSYDKQADKLFLKANYYGYNYETKYLYDVNFEYLHIADNPTPTLADVLVHLSTGPVPAFMLKPEHEEFSHRVDVEEFINSAIGEKTAKNWYTYIMYPQAPMNPNLLEYWERRGLTKEAYYDEEDDNNDGITGDYYVYSPIGAKESNNKSYPAIILFHGGGEPAYQTETFGFCQIAAEEGIILIAPETFGEGDTLAKKTGNINKVLQKVKEEYPIDESRLYAVGSSMGGGSSLAFSLVNIKSVAACAVMDQPVSLDTVRGSVTDKEIKNIQTYGLPIVYVGGLADMYGLYGMRDWKYFYASEGNFDKYIAGWNKLMEAFEITGHDLTREKRQEYADNPRNMIEYHNGYPLDNVETINYLNNTLYKGTFDGVDDLCSIIVENRPHMPVGFDAENIWEFLSKYSRDLKTGMSTQIN